jgi:pyruvate ferredoxin oxidoreductase beta subunit
MAIAGDGGTYDIGLQSLSGAIERGHKFVFVCYDNEAYMNTGIQRSSATPLFANTTTDPIGSVRKGKQELRKNFTEIMIAHNMKYVAQTSLSNLNDFIMKMEKAFKATDDTAAFVNVFSPCIPGWGIHDDDAIKLSKVAVDTCFWPLYEVEDGVYKLSYDPGENKKPITEFLKMQSRFKHLLKPGNEKLVEQFQKDVDDRWNKLKRKCGVE